MTPAPEGFLGITLTSAPTAARGRSSRGRRGLAGRRGRLEAGDVVVAVDDSLTDGVAGVIAADRDHAPGDEITVVVCATGTSARSTSPSSSGQPAPDGWDGG